MENPDFISRRGGGVAENVEFYGDLKRETAEAYLFYDGCRLVWLPKSLVVECEQVTTATYRLSIPEWLAIEKEIV